MPKVEADETREHYLSRCMAYPDLQKHDEAQRTAICEHLFDRESVSSGEAHEQALELPGEIYEQAPAVAKPKIDKEAGIIYHAHIQGLNSKHGHSYATDGVKANQTKWEGMAVGVNHDYSSAPLTVEDTFGTLRNITIESDGAYGDLHYLTKHEQAAKVIEDLERGTGLFALSSVNARCLERHKQILSFVPVRVDVVTGGATTKTILEQEPTEQAKIIREQADKLTAMEAKMTDLEKRLTLREQYVEPKTTLEQTIQKATEPFDLKSFWNDSPKK